MLLRLWRDSAWRAVLFQVLLISLVLLFGGWIVDNTLTNLENRGISTGFDFLSQSAGFGIIQSLIEYNESLSFGHTFVVGLLNTLLVSALGIVFATLLGFGMGVARLSSNWLLAKVAAVYVEVFRNIPLLLQIFFWYFAVLSVLPSPRQSLSLFDIFFLNIRGVFLPEPVFDAGGMIAVWAFVVAAVLTVGLVLLNKRQRKNTGRPLPFLKATGALLLIGLPVVTFWLANGSLHWDVPHLKGFGFKGGIELLPELLALWFALTVYTAAFIAEVVRSGIESVSKGQKEAAAALGLRPGRVMNLVVIPQAMRVIIPPLTNQYLNLIKNSSLATAIGYPDLVSVFAGTTLNQTGQAIEVIAMTMAVYLTISLTVSMLMNMYNRWVALVER